MYETPELLQEKIDDYFKNGVAKKIVKDVEVPVPTITGLVLHCGFADRISFYEYEKKPGFTNTIKKARTFIEKTYEELLHTGNVTGAIFALKNFGWKDRTEIDQSVDATIRVKWTEPDLSDFED